MLSWQTFFAKLLGLTAFISSGLSTGKEGPFIHLISCIANNLPYKDMYRNKTIRHQMIAAAIAVGVTATFGTPIGGVLFSIELTSNVYNIQNLWKAFYSATLSVAIFKLSTLYADVQLFDGSDYHFYANDKLILKGLNKEIPFFIILAILCSLLGCLYIYIHKIYVTMKKRRSDWWCFNPWIYSLFIAFLISTI